MVSFQSLVIGFLLTGLFTFTMISFGANFATDNNLNQTILDNQAINSSFVELDTTLLSNANKANDSKTAFESDVPTIGADSLILVSIVSVGKVFTGITVGVYNITIGLASSVLGISPVILGVLTTILLFVIMLLTWSVIRTGK